MEIQNRTIALLIDSDNVSSDYFSIILDELSQYGNVTYRRLYGDFTNSKANGWKQALLDYSIEQIQQVAFTKGKNATDSKMIIDAMDILYKGNVDCFCLATSDSDFTGLAMRFRNDNLAVIGAGEKKTPASFRKACHIFIPIDELLAAKNGEKQTEKQKTAQKPASAPKKQSKKAVAEVPIEERREKLVRTAVQIVSAGADSEGWMHFSAFMNEIWRKENDFNPKIYGAESSRPIPFFQSLKNDKQLPVFQLQKKDNIDRIRLSTDKNRRDG